MSKKSTEFLKEKLMIISCKFFSIIIRGLVHIWSETLIDTEEVIFNKTAQLLFTFLLKEKDFGVLK